MTSDSPVPVSGVCEIALEQADLTAAEEFYAGVRTRIGLWRPQIGLGGGRGGVHVHYAMGLPAQAYEAVVELLRARGYTVLDHDHSRYGHGRGRAAYVTDPGGHVVEFWTWDVGEHLRELAAGESPGSR